MNCWADCGHLILLDSLHPLIHEASVKHNRSKAKYIWLKLSLANYLETAVHAQPTIEINASKTSLPGGVALMKSFYFRYELATIQSMAASGCTGSR